MESGSFCNRFACASSFVNLESSCIELGSVTILFSDKSSSFRQASLPIDSGSHSTWSVNLPWSFKLSAVSLEVASMRLASFTKLSFCSPSAYVSAVLADCFPIDGRSSRVANPAENPEFFNRFLGTSDLAITPSGIKDFGFGIKLSSLLYFGPLPKYSISLRSAPVVVGSLGGESATLASILIEFLTDKGA
eukprot:Gb_12685 [translate_table: standard]